MEHKSSKHAPNGSPVRLVPVVPAKRPRPAPRSYKKRPNQNSNGQLGAGLSAPYSNNASVLTTAVGTAPPAEDSSRPMSSEDQLAVQLLYQIQSRQNTSIAAETPSDPPAPDPVDVQGHKSFVDSRTSIAFGVEQDDPVWLLSPMRASGTGLEQDPSWLGLDQIGTGLENDPLWLGSDQILGTGTGLEDDPLWSSFQTAGV